MSRHLLIAGRVQGVGYRAGFRNEAQRLGLSGWVRNRLDGSVEALIDGDTAAIADMLAWAHVGPPMARVDKIINTESASVPGPGFEVRTSA